MDKVCENVMENIEKQSKGSDLGLLPSTALAVGYYNGFVKRVCEDLHYTGKMISGTTEFEVKKFEFKIIIPQDLDDNGIDDFKVLYNKKHELTDASTIGKAGIKRGYPLAFKIDVDDDKTKRLHASSYRRPFYIKYNSRVYENLYASHTNRQK